MFRRLITPSSPSILDLQIVSQLTKHFRVLFGLSPLDVHVNVHIYIHIFNLVLINNEHIRVFYT